MGAEPVNPALRRLRQDNQYGFEVSFGYIVSSKLAGTTELASVSKYTLMCTCMSVCKHKREGERGRGKERERQEWREGGKKGEEMKGRKEKGRDYIV